MGEAPRSAGVRTPDRLAAGLDPRRLVEATRASAGSDGTWRTYVRTWVVEGRFPDPEAAWRAYDDRFAGRVDPDHARVVDASPFTALATLEVCRWTVAGEWVSPEDAATQAVRLEDEWDLSASDVEVVARNGRREHELCGYGVLRLPPSRSGDGVPEGYLPPGEGER